MAQSATPADLIVERIGHHPGCDLDDVVMLCPELTWNQIFLEADRLSRDGVLKLALIGPGCYVVKGPPNAGSRMRRSREGPMHMPALEQLPTGRPMRALQRPDGLRGIRRFQRLAVYSLRGTC